MEEKSYKEIEREFVRNVQQEVKDVMRKGKSLCLYWRYWCACIVIEFYL